MMLILLLLIRLVYSIYVPENGDDWTLLKLEPPAKAIETLPFNFGLVVVFADSSIPKNTSQFRDIQIQRTLNEVAPTINGVKQENGLIDGNINSTQINTIACNKENNLLMSLTGGILRDSNNRIGTIISNRQLQFDGPTPQFGTIFANGWSIDNGGNLKLGESSVFYQCSSGTFYNLYDQKIDNKCNRVNLKITRVVDCT